LAGRPADGLRERPRSPNPRGAHIPGAILAKPPLILIRHLTSH